MRAFNADSLTGSILFTSELANTAAAAVQWGAAKDFEDFRRRWTKAGRPALALYAPQTESEGVHEKAPNETPGVVAAAPQHGSKLTVQETLTLLALPPPSEIKDHHGEGGGSGSGILLTDVHGILTTPAETLPAPGILEHDWERKRRIYAALDNETPKQIASKFSVALKQLLEDNKRLHPGLRTNAKLYTRTPIVLPWSQDGAPPKPKRNLTNRNRTGTAAAAAVAAKGVSKEAVKVRRPPPTAKAVFCHCRSPHENKYEFRFMIECGGCKEWFHGDCKSGP